VRWFNTEGVKLKTEADGRMFPVSDDSETIVEALMFAAKKAGVVILTNVLVQKVEYLGTNRFDITLKNRENILCDRLLLATGSSPSGYAIARSLGHELEPPVPSLFTFNIKDSKLHELAGVSVNPAIVKLIRSASSEKKKSSRNQLEQSGALLITHWGLSGPAVLKLSAWAARELHECNYQAKLAVNWIPSLKAEAVKQILLSAKTDQPKKFISNYCPVDISLRLWEYLLNKAEVEPEKRWADVSNKAIQQITNVLTASEYAIAGKGIFKEEFVTCGGIRLQDVNFQTMESKICQGLYFAGDRKSVV
jgi:predicted Rossmann fold flavoprotein